MDTINCRAILLDIEGTVAPVAFVYDVMFPFIRENVGSFLVSHWDEPSVQDAVKLVGIDVERPNTCSWLDGDSGLNSVEQKSELVTAAVNQLMDRDAKVTGLKQLQGLIWKDGFHSGQLVAELFPDVLPKLKEWKSSGIDLYIYSSGSIGAQKLFFGHTTEGDLLAMFSGHFDTTSGNKKQAASYTNIAGQIAMPADSICFVSDVVAELDAAAKVGMKTVLRPQDQQEPNPELNSGHPAISSFDEICCSFG